MKVRHLLLALLASAPLASAQQAAPTAAPATEKVGWEFEIVPYLWTASLDGKVGVGALPPADVDASFGALFENLDLALAAFAVARHGKFSLLADISYTDLSISEPVGASTVTIESELFWTSLSAGYHVDTDPGESVDVFAGARYYQLDSTATAVGGVNGSASQGDDWVDPLLGLLYVHDINAKSQLGLLADIGGFGVGSDLSYEIMPTYSYQFSRVVSGKLGYRWLYVDYESSDLVYDVMESGLIFALGFRF